MNGFAISIDLDWAPDCAIDLTADILRRAGARATWLVTHDSPAVRRLAEEPDLFELGLHPNFMSGSTHGDTPEAVLDGLLDIVPGASAMRSHGLCMSARLLDLAASRGIRTEASIFLPGAPGLAPVPYDTRHGRLMRLPTYWSDDYALRTGDHEPARHEAVPGMKIMCFHPVHVALNSVSGTGYAAFRRAHPAPAAGCAELDRFAEDGRGTTYMFEKIAGLTAAAGGGPLYSSIAPS